MGKGLTTMRLVRFIREGGLTAESKALVFALGLTARSMMASGRTTKNMGQGPTPGLTEGSMKATTGMIRSTDMGLTSGQMGGSILASGKTTKDTGKVYT